MKIDRNFYALSRPFTAQDTNFITGEGINTDLYPLQLPNKKLLLSSAEGIDSELFDQYKMAFEKMLQGDPNYFVCDIDCSFSLNPMMNGKLMKPLITQDEVDNAFATNPYKAEREQIKTKKYSIHLEISVCFLLNCWEFLKVFVLQRNYEIRISANVTKVEKNKNIVQG